ncbi:MAG: outer membrane beta-barrel protein [Gammaproteobacteria bacterium]|nr:outer membrane beta-barrel protein [Gammaproteobacteria bacterium]
MKRTAMFALLALAGGSVHADGEFGGARIGAAAAFGEFKGDDVPAAELGNNFIKDNAVGFKVYGQYPLNDWFAVEGAYHFSNDFEDRSQSEDLPGKLQLSFSGFSVQGVVYIPTTFEEFDAYLKAGYFDFDDDLALSGANIDSSSEQGFAAGGGLLIHIGDNLGVRLDIDWFNADVGDLSSVNLGIEYAFGRREPAGSAAPPPPPPPPADGE